jgi:hypothetical protein
MTSCKAPEIFILIVAKFLFSQQIFIKIISNFTKVCPVEAALIYVESKQRGGHDKVNTNFSHIYVNVSISIYKNDAT